MRRKNKEVIQKYIVTGNGICDDSIDAEYR